MKLLLDSSQVSQAIEKMASQIINSLAGQNDFVVLGIRCRGEILGKRLAKSLSEKLGKEVLSGTLDITLYRDDFNDPQSEVPRAVGITEIPCDIDGKIIILADDVLHTGRSCRAALDAIVAYGRPAVIRLGVLIDRGQREYPIQADYVGYSADVRPEEKVRVKFVESDGKDEVLSVI